MIAGEAVSVLRPVTGAADAMGEPATAWQAETVEGVLFAPGGASDLGAERPNGTRAAATFHFPKGYAASLRGCAIERAGERWRVIGDPRPYMEQLTPGGFGMAVECEAVHG